MSNASILFLAEIAFLPGAGTSGQVFSYECEAVPEDASWDIVQLWCDPLRWVDSGWFYQHVDLCPEGGGQKGSYVRTLDEFIGVGSFFVEWRMETDGDRSELPWGGPSNFSVGSYGPVNYGFSISRDLMDLNRDNTLPIVEAEFEPGVAHTHRLELYGDELYVWYLDGVIVDSGVPEGAYPSFNPLITWRSKAAFLPNTTRWDYIRYGVIPVDGSGDYDSDGDVDEDDFYFFGEYFSGTDMGAGPGGRFADFDEDTDVDCDDWGAFTQLWTGPADPPFFAPCPTAAIPTVSEWGMVIMTLSILTTATILLPRRRRRG